RFDGALAGHGIEVIEFADGVIWTLDDILGRTRYDGTASGETLTGTGDRDNIFGLGGNDVINGGNGDDRIEGGAGNDTLKGGNGNDLYRWAVGDGNDIIHDEGGSTSEVDTLHLVGLTLADIELTTNMTNMTISALSSGESISVQGQFLVADPGHGLEVISFDDGVTIEIRDHEVTEFVLNGTSANDSLGILEIWSSPPEMNYAAYGFGGDDHIFFHDGEHLLVGGSGNDTLAGGNGSDTYQWSRGDGDDLIADLGATADDDRLLLTDVNPGDVSLFWQATDSNIFPFGRRYDLKVTIHGTGGDETITVWTQSIAGLPCFDNESIESIEFADGTVWTLHDIRAKTRIEGGTAGDDTLNGFNIA
ncbi:MAG: hypothetical protein GY708_08660, partial [Actinomycetia bacterium]|nr:hypothetical protein [Actinomycetes bacterium]